MISAIDYKTIGYQIHIGGDGKYIGQANIATFASKRTVRYLNRFIVDIDNGSLNNVQAEGFGRVEAYLDDFYVVFGQSGVVKQGCQTAIAGAKSTGNPDFPAAQIANIV